MIINKILLICFLPYIEVMQRIVCEGKSSGVKELLGLPTKKFFFIYLSG